MSVTFQLEQSTVYAFALGLLKGLGPQNVRMLLSSFATADELQRASLRDIERCVRPSLAESVYEHLHDSGRNWSREWRYAEAVLNRHIKQHIYPLSVLSNAYPALLKKIPDPPAILYAKGNLDLLQNINAVAIVGTREPTSAGRNVARTLSKYFASHNYCIVSGLAKGIDTEAHEGALEVGGQTIAVYATPLDKVYPAANRDLAQRILESGGLVVGELPLGQSGFRSAFVQRDRIQSGLSLSVLPIQTSLDGGTMHTIRFAQEQSRLLSCAVPVRTEVHLKQYEGIVSLIKKKGALTYTFKAGSVEKSDILQRIQEVRHTLIGPSNEPLQIASYTSDLFSHQGTTRISSYPEHVPTPKKIAEASVSYEISSSKTKHDTHEHGTQQQQIPQPETENVTPSDIVEVSQDMKNVHPAQAEATLTFDVDVLQPRKEKSAQEPIQHALIEDEKRVDLYGNVIEDLPVKGRRQRRSSTGTPKEKPQERKTQKQLGDSEQSGDERKNQKRKATTSRKKAGKEIEKTSESVSVPTAPAPEGQSSKTSSDKKAEISLETYFWYK